MSKLSSALQRAHAERERARHATDDAVHAEREVVAQVHPEPAAEIEPDATVKQPHRAISRIAWIAVAAAILLAWLAIQWGPADRSQPQPAGGLKLDYELRPSGK